jgi:hypothetical protein
MFDEVLSSNPPYFPIPMEGEYIWNLEVIVVAIVIDPIVDSTSDKKKSLKKIKRCSSKDGLGLAPVDCKIKKLNKKR